VTAAILSALLTIDDALVRVGIPPMSDYWRGEATKFYTHPSARELVEMVGRGGDKSRTSVKMAIAEVLAGEFHIPQGERHSFVHVSENVDEAKKTLGVLEQYLRTLGIKHHRAGETLELDEMPRDFKVLACRVGAVSGPRCIGWTADERDKWDDDGTDPGVEVIASMRAMTVTHPSARGRQFSSPVSTATPFYEAWRAGGNAHQVVGHAPSWIANPSITKERTCELEPHEPTWRREYAADPSSGSSDAISSEDARAMVRALSPRAIPVGLEIGLLDSSSGRGDGWAFAFARYVRDDGRRVLHVTGLGAFEGRFGDVLSFDAVVGQVAELARARGVSRVYGDQYQAFALASAMARYGIAYVEKPWTQPTKIEALSTLRRLARERSLVAEPGTESEAMRRELLTLREVLLPSKVFTVQARRSGRGHADRASLLLMLARCVSEGDITGGAEPRPAPASSAVNRVVEQNRARLRTMFTGGGGLAQGSYFGRQQPDSKELTMYARPNDEVPPPAAPTFAPGAGRGGERW
jgi:hypothetical protein